ncbi:hypothetical protein Hanom_Chr17g01549541 [Helianthus anomalus]
MNARTKKKGTDIGKIGEIPVKYWSNISQISVKIADNIGTTILTDILHRYLTRISRY